MSDEQQSGRVTALAFASVPVGVSSAWLLTRIAIHYIFWDAVPLFMLAVAVGAVACIAPGVRYAADETGWEAVGRFLWWAIWSAFFTVCGLLLIGLLPIGVGDGP